MAELKPCPFCGGEAKLLTENFGEYVWAKCEVCGVQTSRYYVRAVVDGKDGEKRAIEAWNRRAKV
jgi:Lar family restriction alleviation protein